jgi:protein-tyrosine phosphatase
MDPTIYEVQPSPEYAKSTVPVIVEKPDNWRLVASFKNGGTIYAGGRPFHFPFDDGKMMDWLKANSIQVIISLEDSEEITNKERNLANKRGIEFYSPWVNKVKSPPSCSGIQCCPTKEALEYVVNLIYDLAVKQGKNVYIHCWEGLNRTGMVIAAFRYLKQGKSIREAIEEWENLKESLPSELFNYRFTLINCFKNIFGSQALTSQPLQITEISPSVIETRERTYPVTLTLKGKGLSQVNEITFSWRGPDSGGPKIWKKGDKNWVNSLKIKSDEEMIVNIYVLRNEPPTNEVKEWTWTVTLKNDKGETASKEFKVRYLPSIYEYFERRETESKQKLTISEATLPPETKEIIIPSQLKIYNQKNANANYYGYSNIQIWGKNYKGFILQFDCFDYETYKKSESNSETNFESQKNRKKSQKILDILIDIYKKSMLTPEVNFILPKRQGRFQGVLGLLDNSEFINTGSVGDKVIVGIYGNGKLIKTISLKIGKPPKIVDLNINGIEKLTVSIENFETIYNIFKKKNIPNFYCLINGKNIPCYKIEIGFVDPLFE